MYWAGRLTLCDSPTDIERYDRVFAAYFGDRPTVVGRQTRVNRPRVHLVQPVSAGSDDPDEAVAGDPAGVRAAASLQEVLRHRDIAALTPAEREELRVLLARLSLRGELRTSRRMRVAQPRWDRWSSYRAGVAVGRRRTRAAPTPPARGASLAAWSCWST